MLFTVSGAAADVDIQKLLTAVRVDQWLREDLFQFKWWLLLGLFGLFIFAWWKLIEKPRLPEIILYAVLTTILTMGIVEYGEELTLWDYPTDISPIFPVLTAINLAIVPMVYSLIYQYFHTWKCFVCATIIITCLLSFVFEPILSWGGFYQLLKWKYYYTSPLYITIAIFIRWIVIEIHGITEKAKKKV